jgi:hypothetical protein
VAAGLPASGLSARCPWRYPSAVQTNVLYYGDNLDILRRYIAPESVDLVRARAVLLVYRDNHAVDHLACDQAESLGRGDDLSRAWVEEE